MKKVTVVYTDNAEGFFDCENVRYDKRVAFLNLTDGATVAIPYHNVYMIKEREVTE